MSAVYDSIEQAHAHLAAKRRRRALHVVPAVDIDVGNASDKPKCIQGCKNGCAVCEPDWRPAA
ncbi:MAG: hypothetical protein ACRCV9_03575 [Burkholderiaceae bacterium]